jgi:hypothetical protein
MDFEGARDVVVLLYWDLKRESVDLGKCQKWQHELLHEITFTSLEMREHRRRLAGIWVLDVSNRVVEDLTKMQLSGGKVETLIEKLGKDVLYILMCVSLGDCTKLAPPKDATYLNESAITVKQASEVGGAVSALRGVISRTEPPPTTSEK